MNRFAISVAILAIALSVSNAAHALDIKDYFRLADQDQARFNQTLLNSAEKLFRDQSRSDLALKLDKLFD
jgi:hypothetical protein